MQRMRENLPGPKPINSFSNKNLFLLSSSTKASTWQHKTMPSIWQKLAYSDTTAQMVVPSQLELKKDAEKPMAHQDKILALILW